MRSGIVDAVLTVVLDFVILYFIGKLLSMLGFIVDLRKLRATGKVHLT